MAHVVHLTSVHVPMDIRIFHKECSSLRAAGHTVTLIVPCGVRQSPEVVNGVHILPLPMPRRRRDRMTTTLWRVYRTAVRETGDIYHFHDPELIPIGVLLKLHGKRVIYDVHEDVPRQILSKHWIPRRMRGMVSRTVEGIENTAVRWWDGIVAATPTIARRFPANKTALVQNFPNLAELIPADPMPFAERLDIVAYVGKIVGIRGAREMVQAMAALPGTATTRLDMAGTFEPARLEEELSRLPGWERVNVLGWLTRPQISALLARARVGLVVLHPVRNYLEAQPNKLFEYMAAGIPVVASDFPAWRALIGEVSCGLFVNPMDPEAIADAVRWLLEHPGEAEAMGQRGQAAVRERFSWDAESDHLLELYETCLGRDRGRMHVTADGTSHARRDQGAMPAGHGQ